jgi:hypothetical protein
MRGARCVVAANKKGGDESQECWRELTNIQIELHRSFSFQVYKTVVYPTGPADQIFGSRFIFNVSQVLVLLITVYQRNLNPFMASRNCCAKATLIFNAFKPKPSVLLGTDVPFRPTNYCPTPGPSNDKISSFESIICRRSIPLDCRVRHAIKKSVEI